jgi:hypothetical protein
MTGPLTAKGSVNASFVWKGGGKTGKVWLGGRGGGWENWEKVEESLARSYYADSIAISNNDKGNHNHFRSVR